MYVYLYVSILYAFLNGWTDVDDIFYVCLIGFRDDLDSQLDPVVGPNRALEIYDGNFCL